MQTSALTIAIAKWRKYVITYPTPYRDQKKMYIERVIERKEKEIEKKKKKERIREKEEI